MYSQVLFARFKGCQYIYGIRFAFWHKSNSIRIRARKASENSGILNENEVQISEKTKRTVSKNAVYLKMNFACNICPVSNSFIHFQFIFVFVF